MHPSSHQQRNRRKALRRKVQRSSKVFLYRGSLGLGPNLAVALLDVCEGGAQALLRVELASGQEVEVNLQGLGHRRPYKVAGKVAWCRSEGEQGWRVGIEFSKNVPYRELQQLVV